MDLDAWKDKLKETGNGGEAETVLASRELAAVLKAGIRKSRRSVARAFLLEMAGIALIYAFAASMVIFIGPLRSFQVKIIVLTVAAIVPISVLFGRYFAAARPDLGRPLAKVLAESLRRLRLSLRIYRWIVLILSAAMGAALWTDPAFHALSPAWKWGISGYVLVVAGLSFPYLQAIYGRRLRALENLGRGTGGLDQDAD